MKIRAIVAALFVASLSHEAVAQQHADNYWQDRTSGWHFYQRDPEPIKLPKRPEPLLAPEPAPVQPTAPEDQALSSAWLRDNLPIFRDRAIDDPTQENVELLAYLQRLSVDRAERFSQMWQRVVMANPALDETARSPISALQQAAANAQISVAKKAVLDKISQRVGLMYFYMSTCPYCARQEPILERFQREYGISILPISLDGGPPPTWQNISYVRNEGQAQQLGVMVTPTLVVADTVTGEMHNLAAGLRTDQEIEERLLEMAVVSGWISEVEYEAAVRGEPRRFLTDGLQANPTSDDPAELLRHLREASINGAAGSPWLVAPNQGLTP